MSPRPLTRQESQARTRTRLVAAAEKVFLKHGFHAASTSQIARAAGYTTGAVYSNFASKEQLALAVLEHRLSTVSMTIQDGLAAAEPTVAARLDVIRSLWEEVLGEEPWMLLATEFIIAARHKPALRAQFSDRVEAAAVFLGALLRQQQEELGVEFPIAPDRLAAAVLGLGVGLSVLRVASPSLESDVFADALGLLLDQSALPVTT